MANDSLNIQRLGDSLFCFHIETLYVVGFVDLCDEHLKKKLFEQICSAAEDLGLDPTDPDEGFDIVFKRAKTGPLAFNVEYTLSQLKLKKRPLTDAERALVAEALPIDAKFIRQTPTEVKALLERMTKGEDETAPSDSGTDQESVNELG